MSDSTSDVVHSHVLPRVIILWQANIADTRCGLKYSVLPPFDRQPLNSVGLMETEVSQQLLVEVSRIYKEEGTLTSSLLSALQFVFQSSLLPALDLIDNSKITKIVSPSGRCVFKVIGSSGTHYICLSVLKYCSCAAFKFSALKKKGYILCKHLLAIQLGLAMERLNEEEVSDEAVACMIQQID